MTDPGLRDIWVYLSASPLLGLTMTLVAYGLAYRLYLRTQSNPLANPVVTSVAMLIGLLVVTGTSYNDYFEGGQFVHFLLGPATVALAVPLYQQFSRLRQLWLPVTISLVCGVLIAAGSSIGDHRDTDVPCSEIGDGSGGHGHFRKDRGLAFPDRGASGDHRHHRCGSRNQTV